MSLLRKKYYRLLLTIIYSCSILLLTSQNSANKEYQIKAVFLFNFSQFVEWPDSAFTQKTSPIIIGILGSDPFGSFLDGTLDHEIVNGHPFIVKRFHKISEIKDCHILYIQQEKNLVETLSQLKGKSILTVSDIPDFIQKGGIIKFVRINNKIQFQINPKAADEAGLTLSSKLLRLAEIIIPHKTP